MMESLLELYPFNLAMAIFCDEERAMQIYIPGIESVLSTLTERESTVLKLRYREKKTLVETGREFNITRERVRQIEAKALRKMRHPSRAKAITAVSFEQFKEQSDKYFKLSQEYELLKSAFESVTNQTAEPSVIIPMAKLSETMQNPLCDLELSVRSYNCLKRAGKNTLHDVCKMTESELQRVRNLGRKSYEEVIRKLQEYGLSLRQDV